MSQSNIFIPHLNARAGAPTSGLVSTMSTPTTSVAAVRTSTARVVSSSTKAVQATSTPAKTVVAPAKTTSSSSPVRAVTSSTIAPVKTPSTTATPVVIKTTSTSSSAILPSTSSTPLTSSIPTTTSTSTRTTTSTTRTSSSTTQSSTTPSSSSLRSSSSITSTSSSSSTIDILASASATTNVTSKETTGISGGAIAGIVIGIVVVTLAGGILLYRLIQRRRRANRRMTGGLQAWTDRTSYFSSSGGYGAGVAATRGEREVEAGQVPFREVEDKDQDGGPWTMGEKQMYQEPMLAGVGAGSGYGQQQHQQQSYQPEYQQQPQQPFYQPYPEHQAYGQAFTPHTPTHQTQPQGYPYTPSAATGTPDAYGGTPSPVVATTAIPAQASSSGSALQDGMTVVVRQGFVRTLEDELVIAPGDHLTVVQAYDDGWCLCQSALNEQGVVPQSCLEPVSAYEQGRTSPIQMPLPAVVVSDGNDEVLAPEPDKKLPSLPRSETTKSLAVSEHSERRSSLFLNAAAAGLYLQQQNAMQAP